MQKLMQNVSLLRTVVALTVLIFSQSLQAGNYGDTFPPSSTEKQLQQQPLTQSETDNESEESDVIVIDEDEDEDYEDDEDVLQEIPA